MAKWQFTLELGDFYHLYDPDGDGGITLIELSQKVADRIKKLVIEIRGKSERTKKLRVKNMAFAETISDMADDLENDILPLFEELVETENEDVDDFDYAMGQLYDWADVKLDNDWAGKRMCGVNTFKVYKNEV
jgi:hypothetical protein